MAYWSFGGSHKVSRVAPFQWAIRTLYPYGSTATVRRGPLKGWRLLVSPSMGVSFIWDVDAEAWSWLRFVQPGNCVYDIGANFGQSTLRIANAVGPTGQVVAFEPMPATFRTLCRNLNLNKLKQVTPIEAAAAERDGIGQLAVDLNLPDQGGLASLEINSGALLNVRLVTLDNYEVMGWPRPELLKIDVEGGAGQVIAGARRLFETIRPLVYIELHSQQEHDAVGDLRDRYGYVVRNMQEKILEDPRRAQYCGPLICRPS
jgi:FkbM family methyltransferase